VSARDLRALEADALGHKPHEIWDRVLLLHVLRAAQTGKIADNLRIQKLMFLCEAEGASRGVSVGHYAFERAAHGPFSAELAQDVHLLERHCLVDPETRELTKRAKAALDFVAPEIAKSDEAKKSVELIEAVCAKHKGRESFPELVEVVEEIELPVAGWGNERAKVKDVPMHVHMLRPHNEHAMEAPPIGANALRHIEYEFFAADQLEPESELAGFGVCDTD
jgi:hypothetical protein